MGGGFFSFSKLKKLPKLISYERTKIRTSQQSGCPDHESSLSDLIDKSRVKSARLALLTCPL